MINAARRLATSDGASRYGSRRTGTSIIELGLVVPVLLALLLGIVEFGWLMWGQLALANATREGARAASLGRSAATVQNVIVRGAGNSRMVDGRVLIESAAPPAGGAAPAYTTYADCTGSSGCTASGAITGGDQIRLTSTLRHRQMTGFFPFLQDKVLISTVIIRREV